MTLVTARRLFPSTVAALALLISLIGGAMTGYIVTRTDQTALLSRLNEHELRLSALDRELTEQHKETQDYQVEMRAAVAHAVDLLTDLRLQLAKAGGRRG